MKSDLTVRLKMIADMACKNVSESRRIIDVGSDHGMLSVYCLKNGCFDSAVLTDINPGPAQRSRQTIEDNCLSSKAEVRVTDGLKGVEIRNGDVVVMAGLGGLNMRDIIEQFEIDNPDREGDVTFILQPQKSLPELREWLSFKGYRITDEECCFESGFYYCVLCVKYSGEVKKLTDREIYYGPVMLTKFDERKDYKDFLDRVYGVRARGDERIRRVLEELHEQGDGR